MPIPIICDCTAKLRVADYLAGQHIKCPKCGVLHAVEGADGAAPSAAAPPPDPETVLEESPLSEAEREKLEDELEKGEQLIWADKPDAALAFRYGWFAAILIWVFALIIIGVGVGVVVAGGMGSNGLIVGVVVGMVALACIVGGTAAPFLMRLRKQKTFYAFTNRRALTWECNLLLQSPLKAFGPAELAGMTHQKLTGGAGNLVFQSRVVRDKKGQATHIERFGFFGIRNAVEVQKRMHEYLIDPFVDQLYKE